MGKSSRGEDKSMTEIYLVRHGQTRWNKEQVFRGTSDVPLNESGQEEARLTAKALRTRPVSAVYTSPLVRASETAGAIAGAHDLEVENLEGLRDICFGEWQGVSHTVVMERYPGLYRRWLEEPHRVMFPGGDSLRTVQSRAVKAVKRTVLGHPEDTIVMVSHRVVNRVLICGLVGIGLSHFWQIGQDTAAINRLTWRKGGFILVCLNDTCHLRAMEDRRVRVDF
jgi:broad specificity phosphatase PhoE